MAAEKKEDSGKTVGIQLSEVGSVLGLKRLQ